MRNSTIALCSLFGFVFFGSCNSYQRIDYNKPSQEVIDLTNKNLSKHAAARKRILFNAVKDYIKHSDFTDENGNVTEDSVWDFKHLFESGAEVFNDLQLNSDKRIVSVTDYVELVRNYMNRKGVKVEYDTFDINSFYRGGEEQYKPRIDDSVVDDDIFYYTYSLEKRIYNILNKNNQVLIYDEPMIYPIEITFRISINNQSAQIVAIQLDKNKIDLK